MRRKVQYYYLGDKNYFMRININNPNKYCVVSYNYLCQISYEEFLFILYRICNFKVIYLLYTFVLRNISLELENKNFN